VVFTLGLFWGFLGDCVERKSIYVCVRERGGEGERERGREGERERGRMRFVHIIDVLVS
jgi:hypothetical protein